MCPLPCRLLFAVTIAACYLAGCSPFQKTLEYGTVESPAMGEREMDFAVWTPPEFTDTENLPLVLFLHGGGDSHDAFDRNAVATRLYQATKAEKIPRAIILLPSGENGFWVDWFDRSRLYETWVIDELLPYVQETYGTKACPDNCHIMGVSMGGAGTMSMTMHHPELFASATVISAPIFDQKNMISFSNNRLYNGIIPVERIWGSVEPKARLKYDDPFVIWDSAETLKTNLSLVWATGDRPGIPAGNKKLAAHLRNKQIEVEAGTFAGGHNWKSWTPTIERALIRHVGGDESVAVPVPRNHSELKQNFFRCPIKTLPYSSERGPGG